VAISGDDRGRNRPALLCAAGGAVVGRFFRTQLERVIGGAMTRLARDLK
jgi:hypothetical protein